MNRRYNYRLLLLSVLALLMGGAAGAQGAALQAGVAAAPTDDSVLLRWLLPDHTYPEGGFVISREGGGAAVSTALPAPLPLHPGGDLVDACRGKGAVDAGAGECAQRVDDPGGLRQRRGEPGSRAE